MYSMYCVVYLEVLVIAEHLDNILFCHYSKIVFEYESLAIFAGNTQKYSCPSPPLRCPHLFCIANSPNLEIVYFKNYGIFKFENN